MTREEMIERAIRSYAGGDYAEPRRVEVASLDVFDHDDFAGLARAIAEFRAAYTDAQIEAEIEYWEEGRIMVFRVYRDESASEITARVGGYRARAEQMLQERRQEYLRMRREFGDEQ